VPFILFYIKHPHKNGSRAVLHGFPGAFSEKDNTLVVDHDNVGELFNRDKACIFVIYCLDSKDRILR
jgi:hypothetical protein